MLKYWVRLELLISYSCYFATFEVLGNFEALHASFLVSLALLSFDISKLLGLVAPDLFNLSPPAI